MYVSPYVAQALHESRVREAQKNADHNRVVRELSEAVPVFYGGLSQRISQWLHRNEQPKAVRDVRHAHAV